MATKMTLADFDNGRQKPVAADADALPKRNRVEHLVPRKVACHSDAKLKEIVDGPVVTAVARLTTDLLKEHCREMYDRMQKHAPTFRLCEDAVWTSGRLAFMQAGSSCKLHRDSDNMPGTYGVDCVLGFGEVGGATLSMYLDQEAPLKVSVDQTVFADSRQFAATGGRLLLDEGLYFVLLKVAMHNARQDVFPRCRVRLRVPPGGICRGPRSTQRRHQGQFWPGQASCGERPGVGGQTFDPGHRRVLSSTRSLRRQSASMSSTFTCAS